MKVLSYILSVLSMVMIFVPFPAFVYLVQPYARTTRDPDAVEAPAWFLGIFLMLIGSILVPVAIGIWLYARKQIPIKQIA